MAPVLHSPHARAGAGSPPSSSNAGPKWTPLALARAAHRGRECALGLPRDCPGLEGDAPGRAGPGLTQWPGSPASLASPTPSSPVCSGQSSAPGRWRPSTRATLASLGRRRLWHLCGPPFSPAKNEGGESGPFLPQTPDCPRAGRGGRDAGLKERGGRGGAFPWESFSSPFPTNPLFHFTAPSWD